MYHSYLVYRKAVEYCHPPSPKMADARHGSADHPGGNSWLASSSVQKWATVAGLLLLLLLFDGELPLPFESFESFELLLLLLLLAKGDADHFPGSAGSKCLSEEPHGEWICSGRHLCNSKTRSMPKPNPSDLLRSPKPKDTFVSRVSPVSGSLKRNTTSCMFAWPPPLPPPPPGLLLLLLVVAALLVLRLLMLLPLRSRKLLLLPLLPIFFNGNTALPKIVSANTMFLSINVTITLAFGTSAGAHTKPKYSGGSNATFPLLAPGDDDE
jgi:hypothetical protein